MSLAANIITVTVTTMQVVVGFTLNACIVSFSFKSMKTRPTSNPTSLIYFIMGLLNVFMDLVFTVEAFIYIFTPLTFFTEEISFTMIMLSMTVTYSSFWLTGWLCTCYCVTISNFSHWFLGILKQFLASFLPHILLLSVIGPFVMSIFLFWMARMICPIQSSINNTQTSFGFPLVIINPVYSVMVTLLGCCLPFILTLGSTGVTVSSLIRHINNMKYNVAGDNCPNLQALFSATKTMVLFLIFSIISYITEFLWMTFLRNPFSDRSVIIWFMITSFPTAEAMIIAQAIPKLRKMILDRIHPTTNRKKLIHIILCIT
ncbi:taste receptor type 2 member 40-like [Hyperolius riggenbachi]|uniref:taste receptor type 2 member 40-like n=1 Tax=Hyperolius riggenbachi TaxID=752182 RepID=UPI0035A31A6E